MKIKWKILWGVNIMCALLVNTSAEQQFVKTNKPNFTLQTLSGSQTKPYYKSIANMRINMFREFPYLYEGSYEYEEDYLNTYFNSSHSAFMLVLDSGKVVGFSTSIPLAEELEEIQAPFKAHHLPVKDYLYVGEVMLEEPYRGQGILRKFLEYHEERAKILNIPHVTLMSVIRPEDHPMQTEKYRKLDPIWQHFGYKRLENMDVKIKWKQVDTHKDEENILALWVKEIESV